LEVLWIVSFGNSSSHFLVSYIQHDLP
jgi:hypothetical protein